MGRTGPDTTRKGIEHSRELGISHLEQVYRHDPARGLEIAESILAALDTLRDREVAALCIMIKGLCLYLLYRFEPAMEHLTKARILYLDIDDPIGLMRTENGIGGVHLASERYIEAVHRFMTVVDLALQNNDIERLTTAYINLGNAYERIGELEVATEYLMRAQEVSDLTENPLHKGLIHLTQGTICKRQGDLDTARSSLERAVEILRPIYGVESMEASSRLAEVLSQAGAHDEAESHLRRALERDNGMGSHLPAMGSWFQLGTLLMSQGSERVQDAITSFERSLELAERIGNPQYIRMNSRHLFALYRRVGDHRRAADRAECLFEGFEGTSSHPYEAGTGYQRDDRTAHVPAAKRLERAERERDVLRRHSAELESGYVTLHTLHAIGQEIVSMRDFDQSLSILYDRIGDLMPRDVLAIITYDREQDDLVSRYTCERRSIRPQFRIPLGSLQSLSALCARECREIIISRGSEEVRTILPGFTRIDDETPESESFIFLPLFIKEELVGVVSVQSYESDRYGLRELEILKTIGDFIAVALANQNYMNELRTVNESLVMKQQHLETALEELQTANRKIERMATFDSLTGLPNRYLLFERLRSIINLAQRNQRPFGVLFIDLDDFKALNDTFGHRAGDEALIKLAERVRTSLRKSDLIARIGGDEFIAVFDDIRSVDDLPVIAGKMIEIFSEPIILDCGESAQVGASVGISSFPTHGVTSDQLIERADIALYRSKSLGKGRFTIYSESFADLCSRLSQDFFTFDRRPCGP